MPAIVPSTTSVPSAVPSIGAMKPSPHGRLPNAPGAVRSPASGSASRSPRPSRRSDPRALVTRASLPGGEPVGDRLALAAQALDVGAHHAGEHLLRHPGQRRDPHPRLGRRPAGLGVRERLQRRAEHDVGGRHRRGDGGGWLGAVRLALGDQGQNAVGTLAPRLRSHALAEPDRPRVGHHQDLLALPDPEAVADDRGDGAFEIAHRRPCLWCLCLRFSFSFLLSCAGSPPCGREADRDLDLRLALLAQLLLGLALRLELQRRRARPAGERLGLQALTGEPQLAGTAQAVDLELRRPVLLVALELAELERGTGLEPHRAREDLDPLPSGRGSGHLDRVTPGLGGVEGGREVVARDRRRGDLGPVAQQPRGVAARARRARAGVEHVDVEVRIRADEGVAEGLERVAGRPCRDPDVGAVVAIELHVGAIVADALDDRVAREVGRADDRGRPADHGTGLVGLVGVARADRGDVGTRRQRALVEGDRARRERARDHVRGLAEVGRAVLDLDRVDLRVVGLGVRVVPRAAAADGPADHGRVVDLRPAAGRLDRAELRRRRDPVRDLFEVTVGLALVDRAAAEIGERARAEVVVVALIGGDLGAGDDQLAGIVALVAADLTPVDVVVVVDEADEVEAGAPRRRAGRTRS